MSNENVEIFPDQNMSKRTFYPDDRDISEKIHVSGGTKITQDWEVTWKDQGWKIPSEVNQLNSVERVTFYFFFY